MIADEDLYNSLSRVKARDKTWNLMFRLGRVIAFPQGFYHLFFPVSTGSLKWAVDYMPTWSFEY